MSTIAHKDELSRYINRLRQFFPDDFSFYPQTWLLPEDQESFESYAHTAKGKKKKKTYIVKPDEGAQGEGIFLIQHPRDIAHLKQPSIVQEYISKPLLLHGLKFDLRLYVLIASLDPPQVYLSDSGMARFCTVPYEAPSVSNMHETFMHLTNYSLNKRSKEFVFSERVDEGSKRTLDSVLKELESQGCDVKEMWERVGELVCKTVLALLPQLMVEGKSYMSEHSLRTPINGFQVSFQAASPPPPRKLHQHES
jgi:tubulin polyglutamylase TTLL11